MTFPVDALDRLLAVADPKRRSVVAGLYALGGHGTRFSSDSDAYVSSMLLTDRDGIAEDAPIHFDLDRPHPPLSIDDALTYSNGQPVRVDATGVGFLLVRRGVAEAIAHEHGRDTLETGFAPPSEPARDAAASTLAKT